MDTSDILYEDYCLYDAQKLTSNIDEMYQSCPCFAMYVHLEKRQTSKELRT